MIELFFHIHPEKIGWLRFILEGYDNQWLLSTVDRRQGLIRIMGHRSSMQDLFKLLTALAPRLTPARPARSKHEICQPSY